MYYLLYTRGKNYRPSNFKQDMKNDNKIVLILYGYVNELLELNKMLMYLLIMLKEIKISRLVESCLTSQQLTQLSHIVT